MIEKPTMKSSLKALLYIAPMMLIVGTFNLYPIIQSFLMSFYQDYNIFTGEVGGYGISNFIEILQDPDFMLAIRNTFIFVLGVVPISIIISLTIAMLLTKINALSSFFRSIYFLPFVTSTVAISIVWSWIYHSRFGLLNYVLGQIGFSPIEFLENPDYAILSLVIMAVWKTCMLKLNQLSNQINKQTFIYGSFVSSTSLDYILIKSYRKDFLYDNLPILEWIKNHRREYCRNPHSQSQSPM